MNLYGVYFIDPANHISRPPKLIECIDEQEATQRAHQLMDGLDIELWEEARLIARIPHK